MEHGEDHTSIIEKYGRRKRAIPMAAIEEAIGKVVELTNTETAAQPQLPNLDDRDPMERFADAAAKSIEASGHDVMAAAESHLASCMAMADEVRRAAGEMATASRKIINRINKAALGVKAVRDVYHGPDDLPCTGTTTEVTHDTTTSIGGDTSRGQGDGEIG